ncbi:hypothetical protein EDD18DRAFT_1114207 [Armillaria luteobubalina]|uniref:Uncharacterized protein n=1 Tax=Armillaria luteobubalina TaxID=153913 RepID=A0AA39P708_9AGAR|nr:hypothetical protein EDD18DRAFT_1114207 [Armillaria luteobubalina]
MSNSLLECFKPSHLRLNRKLLMHHAAPSLSLQPFDGLYGAILDDLDMFVITPNTKTVMPCPSLGNCKIYMRENYRYSFDDPLQWPQAFVPDYAHYGCLCWCQPPVSDPLRPLYLGVTEYDWRELDDFAIVTMMSLETLRSEIMGTHINLSIFSHAQPFSKPIIARPVQVKS